MTSILSFHPTRPVLLIIACALFAAPPAPAQSNRPASTEDPTAQAPPDQPAGDDVPPPADAQPPDDQHGENDNAQDHTVQPLPAATIDLSSPRAAMRSFLAAVEAAKGDRPERIQDAVRCLDTSGLEGGEIDQKAQALALRLHGLIDRLGVKLQDMPDQVEQIQSRYEFATFDPDGDDPTRPEVALARGEDGLWRFTPETLASIPTLERRLAEVTEEPSDVQSDVPAARRTPRATIRTFIESMNADPPEIDEAILCLNPDGQDRETWPTVGRELASKLKNVMDKTAQVIYADVPESPESNEYVWYASSTGNIVIGRIDEPPAGMDEKWKYAPTVGEWRFTPKTLKTVSTLYAELEDRQIVKELQEAGVREQLTLGMWIERRMPPSLRREILYLQGWQWAALAALIPIAWFVRLIVSFAAGLVLRAWLRRKHIELDKALLRRSMWWLGCVAALLLWFGVIHILVLPPRMYGFLFKGLKFLLVVSSVWASYRLVDIIGGYINSNKNIRLTPIDEVLIPLLTKILRVFVVVVVIVFVLQMAGLNVTTILGALGVGGVAVAFAAQDTLGNFFGSVTVLFDRPFGIGDWIVIDDIEGTVERVGFRSTRVRTFYNSVVTIPNSRMVNRNVDNYGARRYRRIRIMISITYATPPDRIEAFCEGIRELIRLHPYTRKDYYHVYLNQFAASSLDILLYMFLETPDWGTELRERHRLFLDIVRLAERLGVEFAFPTRTVWLERNAGDAQPSESSPFRVEKAAHSGVESAAKVYHDAYGTEPKPRPPVVIEPMPKSKSAPGGPSPSDTGA